jgi:RNA polymerase sigma factor (sigma-70 family)
MTDAAIPLPARPALPSMRLPARAGARALGALSDRRLAELAGAGAGEQPFAAIYARYHQPLYRYCQSIVRDAEDAADALQSAMLKAHLALPAKRAEVPLKPWLFRIVHNEAISVIRRRGVHEEMTEANAPQVPSADEDAATRARLAELVDDLQELDERQRAALVMRELSGLGYHEIAAAFGTSAATAKQAVYEARVALQERAEGRAMSCEPVRRAVSDGDRRRLRGRKVRAHIRACGDCRAFELALGRRRADLAALAPPLPAPAAAALLRAVLGTGAGGSGDAGLGAGLGAAANAAALKTLAVAMTVAAGAGGVGVVLDRDPARGAAAAVPAQHRAIALARSAPPLESVYVLSDGHVRLAPLRAPQGLVAATSPSARVPSPAGAGGGTNAPAAVAPPQASGDDPSVEGDAPRLPQLPGVQAPADTLTNVAPSLPAVPSVPAVPPAPTVDVPQQPAAGLPSLPDVSVPALPLP